MPVTLNIVDHAAKGWQSSKISSSNALLKEACPRSYRRCERIVQCSFNHNSLREHHISASQNGLVWSAYHAYSSHHHLVIRPEDVWFAILTQMSFYINAHAEELRAFFVEHDGKKHLEVLSSLADFGSVAQEMADLIAKNVVDPGLRDWVMPSFSTTTDCDKVVGAVLFMGAMQKYFSYGIVNMCGLPSVTLLGEVEDWQEMLARLDKLELLGKEPTAFARMLKPILSHMVLSFQEPTSAKVEHFWNTIVHENRLGSGTDYLTGWLTAFCFWDENGKAKHLPSMSEGFNWSENTLFGDVAYPRVDVDDVPTAFASVPVHVNDNGHKYNATMVAGSVGIVASVAASSSTVRAGTSSADLAGVPSQIEETHSNDPEQIETGTRTELLDTVQPLSGWWIFENTKDQSGKGVVEGEMISCQPPGISHDGSDKHLSPQGLHRFDTESAVPASAY